MKKTYNLFALVFIVMINQSTFSQTILPFHLVDGYILIDAKVNDTQGKFLFDSGTPTNFMLNNNLIDLDKNTFVANGTAGSGQKLTVYKSTIKNITIKNSTIEFNEIENVMHTNFKFMQDSIASDILGTIGYQFMKDYVVTIDYNRQIIKLDDKLQSNNSKLIVSLPYSNLNNYPEVVFQTKNKKTINAYFDTGSLGAIMFTKSKFEELIQEEYVKIYNQNAWYGIRKEQFKTYKIETLKLKNKPFHIENIYFIESDKNKISLGYSFLKNYISVWDFQNKMIYLYENK